MLADVVLPSRRFQVFTYQIPQPLLAQIVVGSPVLIPLGTTVVSGVVVRIVEKSALPSRRASNPTLALRDILCVDATPEHSSLDQRLLALVERIAEYYLAPLSACLRLIVPPRLFKVAKRLILTEAGRKMIADPSVPVEEQMVLQKLTKGLNGVLRSSLLRTWPQAGTLVTKFKRKGWIEERSILPGKFAARSKKDIPSRQVSVPVSPYGAMSDLFEQNDQKPKGLSSSQLGLSEKMSAVAEKLVNDSISGTFQKHIVIETDHERFQIFQQVALTLLQRGKRVLFLFPEVHQAETAARKLRGSLSESVEVYHGKLSTPVRAERWERIRQGQIQLVVGTRSALFLSLPDLSLIWVDQEENAAYKDEHLPYYHAREVARMRGVIEQALVVYGSSCPSLETYAEFRDKIQENVQAARPQHPEIHLIHMRDHVSKTLLAPLLIERLTQVLNERQQAIIILNRKGFSQSLICRDCGQTPACEMCGVSLRLFQRPSRLLCSYCGKTYTTPEICTSCMGTVFRFSGVGTQRLEEELTTLFPSHNLFRFDRDQVKTAGEAENVFYKFRQGDIHLIIGTEFLLHQPDPPTVKLIAFPQADLGLHLPDFRSAERTFHLLSKSVEFVQTNAQTKAQSGEVYLQTRMPDHHVFQAILQGVPHVFYRQELDFREALAYSPAAHLLLLVVTGTPATRVQRMVDFLAQQLKDVEMQRSVSQGDNGRLELPMMLGPLSSRKPGRVKKNRTIFLIKTWDLPDTQRRLRKIQQAYDRQFAREPVVFEVHVDPLEIQ